MPNVLKKTSTVVVVTLLYMAIAIPYALSTGNKEFVLYWAVMLVLGGFVGLVHWRAKLSVGVLWGLSFWGAMHMAGGLLPVPAGWPIEGDIRVFYSWWLIPGYLKYDNIVHAFGFAMTTIVCWQCVRRLSDDIRPSLGVLILCGAAGMGFGAFNEIVEFIATLTVPDTNVGGYVNTGWDLVSNMVGATVACVLIRIFSPAGRQPVPIT